jgi:beta-galactosidase
LTAAAAAGTVLTVEPPLVKPSGEAFKITANGSDAAFILAKVVDAQGNWVPTANQNVTFAVTGPGTYRGGSDQYVTAGQPASYHAPRDPELQMEGGMCKIAVKSQFTPGTVTVTATGAGLGQGTASFPIVAP